jgi:two-component system CheB/CheR fusion protein
MDSMAIPVVGIGASAGGLDAFLELISAMPTGTGLAFVLIQHLHPRHDSLLVDILAGATTIPVQEVTDRMTIEPDHIYVIPPDAQMTIESDVLLLAPRTPKVPHRPLDTFFFSLAEDRTNGAIGVVLSGNDADGSRGLRAIHDGGGITFAQDPESAKFDVMPRAAAVAADFVLPPAGIAERLVSIARGDASEPREPASSAADFDRVHELLRAQHPVDFSHFKRATIGRRILRRVLLGNHDSLSSYADSLDQDGAAVETLYEDLLIGVTSFFREPARFEALKTVVFPALMQNGAEGRRAEESVRIWVAGCSTGEEVYSLAITLLEFLDGRPDAPRIAIYGTDINEKSLTKARAAVFTQRALSGVSPERLTRFFTPAPGGYRIAKALRELCVFAAHDLTRDPPYSRIDLATCCNVLIYFDPELQKKAVGLLQYALAPGGFLMLGSSESLRGTTNQLTVVSAKPLIYRKVRVPGALATFELARARRIRAPPRPRRSRAVSRAATEKRTKTTPSLPRISLRAVCCQRTDGDHAHSRRCCSVHRARTGRRFLDLFSLIRHHEVLAALRPAVRRAFREQVRVTREDIPWSTAAFAVAPRSKSFRTPFSPRPRPLLDRVPQQLGVDETQGVVDRRTNGDRRSRHALAAAIDDRELR